MSDIDFIKQELAQADLFYDFDPLLIELVASVTEVQNYSYGDLIFDENAESHELYIVAEGEVQVQISPRLLGIDGDDYQTLSTLRRGQNFGEIALLDEGRRSARAFCSAVGTTVLRIPREKINVMCENVPQLGYHLMRSLAMDLAMKIRNTDLEIRAELFWTPRQRD